MPNEPIRVYDTSGPWGNVAFHGDAAFGLPALRAKWIQERGDVEPTKGHPVQPLGDGYLSEKHRAQAEAEGGRNPIRRQLSQSNAGVLPGYIPLTALNGAVVPRSEWQTRRLTADDRAIVIQATQGG